MIRSEDISQIGRFQKTHALKGELNAIIDVSPEFINEGNALIVDIDGIYVPFYASSIRPKGATSFLIKLDGVESEQEARSFVNKIIYGLRSQLADFLDLDEQDILEEDDLAGFEVIDSASNEIIGIITSVDSSTANLLFIVETPDGNVMFIPAVEEFIDNINEMEKKIYMTLPDGLLELNKK